MPERLGKYRILGTLGTGASGAVFLAHDEELDRDVALKQLAPELAAKPGFLDDFRIEAEIMGRLDHPNCVRVFDFIEEGRAFYIVSEFVDGASLRRVLEDAGRLNPEQALGVTRGALSGLAHAHELGLVHRDIKPENLLADHEGTSKLADFGQAYFTGETLGGGRQSTGEASGGGRQSTGSPAYMSPEQVRGEQGDARSDVYSAGAVMYEFMAGRPPFIAISRLAVMKMHLEREPPDLSRVNARLPRRVAAVVAQALGKEPESRYETAAQFLAALEEVAQEEYGKAWRRASSIAALVTAVSAATAVTAAAAGGPAAAATQVGEATVAGAPPPEPEPEPHPEPVAEPVVAESPAPAEPAVVKAAVPPRRGGVAPALLGALAGLLLGAGLAMVVPLTAVAPAPAAAPSPSPPAASVGGPPVLQAISAHFDEAQSTTFYEVTNPPFSASYRWGWIHKPTCGNLLADPAGVTAGYSHNGCNQVLEATAVVGVCVSTADGATLYQRNARFGDGALSSSDAAAAGVAGDQFSAVGSSTAAGYCNSSITRALAAAVTPLPAAPSPSPSLEVTSPSPSASASAAPAGGTSDQLPVLGLGAALGALLAGLGIALMRRPRVAP